MPADHFKTLENLLCDLDFASGQPLGESNQGEVRRFRLGSQDLAIKQPKGRGLAWRVRAGTLRHEYQAYQRLAGLDGFARCHGLFAGDRLVLDYVPGRSLRDDLPERDHPFWPRLLGIIQAMHERGVAHGDLKRKANLLIDPDGNPVIVDLGTATLKRDAASAVNSRLFALMRQTDINAWIKLKYGGYSELSEADAALFRRTRIERWLGQWRKRQGHLEQ